MSCLVSRWVNFFGYLELTKDKMKGVEDHVASKYHEEIQRLQNLVNMQDHEIKRLKMIIESAYVDLGQAFTNSGPRSTSEKRKEIPLTQNAVVKKVGEGDDGTVFTSGENEMPLSQNAVVENFGEGDVIGAKTSIGGITIQHFKEKFGEKDVAWARASIGTDAQHLPQGGQQPQNCKEFICSYGGVIHRSAPDNQPSYIGGETKILAVDSNLTFSDMISKLSALCGATDVSFMYQLPNEDPDVLISVTNDEDLEHMMHEYVPGRRMRLFLSPVNPSPANFEKESGKSDRHRFFEALNSTSSAIPPPPLPVEVLDFPKLHVKSGHDDGVIGSEQQPTMYYRTKSDEIFVGGYAGGGDDNNTTKLSRATV